MARNRTRPNFPNTSQQIHSGTNNTRLVEIANSAVMEDQSIQQFVSAWHLNNSGLLLEMDSEGTAKWLNTPSNTTAFLSHLRQRRHSQFVPLQFKPDKDADLHSLEVVNRLPTGSIGHAQWIKPAYCRAPEQTCGHLLVVMTRPEDSNTVLTDRLLICQKRVYAEKCKKEPTRCLKCHGWEHVSYVCPQPFSICGTCVGCHRTSDCTNGNKPQCMSCRVDGHASWSCHCPVFLHKCEEMDDGLMENQMPYFPTAEPWTHPMQLSKPLPPPVYEHTRHPPSRRGTAGWEWMTAAEHQRAYRQTTLNFPTSQPHSLPGKTNNTSVKQWGDHEGDEGLPSLFFD